MGFLGLTFLFIFQSTSGAKIFSADETLALNSVIQEAQQVGPEIVFRDRMIKRVCVQGNTEACEASFVVRIEGEDQPGNRALLNPNAFSDLPKIRARSIDYADEILFPITVQMNGGLCVPVLAPISYPLDVMIMPFTYPVAEIVRAKARTAIRALFSDSRTKPVKLLSGATYGTVVSAIAALN